MVEPVFNPCSLILEFIFLANMLGRGRGGVAVHVFQSLREDGFRRIEENQERLPNKTDRYALKDK